ncbi:hypothetical protein [Streptomyces wuyuanensis]|uniref:DUF7224 domain-containing protein n=1 Tax=Streptomyces wuyuanensis TaxID=1196353 RepID=UPI00371B8D63
MITWANLRASAALWLVLPVLFYASLYIGDVTYTVPSHYGVESGELAAFPIAIIAPAVAGAAAWESGRHRRLGVMRTTSARPLPRQILRATTPVLLLHLVLAAGSLILARQAVGVWPAGAGWLAVGHLILLPVGWLIIGWNLGLLLPRSIAAPAVAIGSWSWLSMPHTLDSPWLRHLGGYIDGTSTVTDIRDGAAYLVPWVATTGVVLASWALTGITRRTVAVTSALIAVAATLLAGRALVVDWGYHHPRHPRTVALTCTGQAPRVCVPPEYGPYADQLRHDALAPLKKLTDAGLPAPHELRVTSPDLPLTPGAWPLYWSLPAVHDQPDPDAYPADLAESAIAGVAAAHGVTDCRQPGSPAAAWAALTVGINEREIRQAMPAADWATLESVRRLSAPAQADWFTKQAIGQKHCSKVLS